MPEENIWRDWVNGLKADDLPEDGISSPDIEKISKTRVKGVKGAKEKLFVQKIVTELYVYTDMQNKMFGQHTFQDAFILGEMTGDRLLRLLEREARKREHRE